MLTSIVTPSGYTTLVGTDGEESGDGLGDGEADGLELGLGAGVVETDGSGDGDADVTGDADALGDGVGLFFPAPFPVRGAAKASVAGTRSRQTSATMNQYRAF